MIFSNKHIVVGIAGGIAAFKAAGLVSMLKQLGADVHCIMTEHATKLVTPLTFAELSGNPVAVDMFSHVTRFDVAHIALARLADLFVIAPATANILGKVANGIADDMLSTTVMATKAKVLFVPAMNTNMYTNEIVQDNINKLHRFGYLFMEPDSGHLACNTSGMGRFPERERIIERIEQILCTKNLLAGKKVLISAGGTVEDIDPVRYISNRSSGRMGYAIAKAANIEGAKVTLISCNKSLPVPLGVQVMYVDSARELDAAMKNGFSGADIVIQAAAVSDYRPKTSATQKIKKENNEALHLDLVQNPDILYGLGQMKRRQYLVGFAAETNDVLEHGWDKLRRKNLDMLVANDVAMPGAGFDISTNIISLLFKDGRSEQFPKLTKEELGDIIIERIAQDLPQ
ncbi:MAG: bifunctional phosphopantothenoylcysteine decarboxylase/phosphopantothenate--cysteine ligase CoaBC [Dialister sp.]|nr:bifunctional phosphopantothenoylcysteine decarboxylase/phosphopantothenate--cysteine ligase CoaBC [Dialister sp.]